MENVAESIAGLDLSTLNPISIGINILVSTIITGIVILILAYILTRSSGGEINPINVFIIALITSIINATPVLSFFASLLPAVPFLHLLLPLVLWILLLKLFIRDMELVHVLILALVCYIFTSFLLPLITPMLMGFIPLAQS
ncbi:MAG TPA: hypothetical protein ENG42_00320 [Candidatus Aenigmarchaeota archaeon]|nr:hypothetical protein [Candidatus Aenigmarchaeota archaeon]